MRIILAFFIFASCQNTKIKNEISTIVLDRDEHNKIEINKNESYGPSPLNSFKIVESTAKDTRVFALHLTPQLYNSYLYIPYLKKLKKKNVEIHVISGYGFSAVLAGLYANSKNFNEFEWKVFRLYKKLEKEKAFSGSWQAIIKESLEEEFKSKRAHELKRLLLIPFRKDKRVRYYFDVPVKDLIMRSLTSRANSNYFIRPIDMNQAFKEVSSCDECLSVAVMPKMLIFKDQAGDKLQIYSKILGHVAQNKHNYITINDVDSYLDSPSGLEIFYSKYDKSIENAVEETINKTSTK